jgi:hypothetical protein
VCFDVIYEEFLIPSQFISERHADGAVGEVFRTDDSGISRTDETEEEKKTGCMMDDYYIKNHDGCMKDGVEDDGNGFTTVIKKIRKNRSKTVSEDEKGKVVSRAILSKQSS